MLDGAKENNSSYALVGIHTRMLLRSVTSEHHKFHSHTEHGNANVRGVIEELIYPGLEAFVDKMQCKISFTTNLT